MCGIAGRILSGPGQVGRDLVDLMDAQSHRGADSTGFAIYTTPRDTGYVLRGMGFDRSAIDKDLSDFTNLLRDNGSDFLGDPQIFSDEDAHYCFRAEIKDPKDLAAWVSDADTLSDRIEVQSCRRQAWCPRDGRYARIGACAARYRKLRVAQCLAPVLGPAFLGCGHRS